MRGMEDPQPGQPTTPPLAIIVSRYHGAITSRLLDGAIDRYRMAGGRTEHLSVIDAPGAFELPVLASAAARSTLYAGVVALGCIIKGETSHDRVIAGAVAEGLTRVSLDTGKPVGLGLLTVDTEAQAMARAGGDAGNKGEEAMMAVLDVLASLHVIGEAERAGEPGRARRTLFRTIAALGAHGAQA
jgi:6,7-dimethyl-8-ribityllumazine synthase